VELCATECSRRDNGGNGNGGGDGRGRHSGSSPVTAEPAAAAAESLPSQLQRTHAHARAQTRMCVQRPLHAATPTARVGVRGRAARSRPITHRWKPRRRQYRQ